MRRERQYYEGFLTKESDFYGLWDSYDGQTTSDQIWSAEREFDMVMEMPDEEFISADDVNHKPEELGYIASDILTLCDRKDEEEQEEQERYDWYMKYGRHCVGMLYDI